MRSVCDVALCGGGLAAAAADAADAAEVFDLQYLYICTRKQVLCTSNTAGKMHHWAAIFLRHALSYKKRKKVREKHSIPQRKRGLWGLSLSRRWCSSSRAGVAIYI
jgi:hypothetical protein